MSEATDEPAAKLDPFTAELATRGFAIADGLPANYGLRAEALARLGKSEDVTGYVTPQLIAEAKARLERLASEAKAAEEAAAKEKAELGRMKVEDLRDLAEKESIAVPADADKPKLVDTIIAARAARSEG